MRREILILAVFGILTLLMQGVLAEETCINCHRAVTPGIVSQYENSTMAKAGVTCLDCHGEINGVKDPSIEYHNGYRITPVVSPLHCKKCHPKEYEEFMRSKHAWAALIAPFKFWYKDMVNQGKIKPGEAPTNDVMLANDPYEDIGKRVSPLYPASGILKRINLLDNMTGYRSTLYCMECHGSAVIAKDGKIIKGWPNNGIGRLNPDGVPGSCSACHTRHKFDKAEARKPETCGQCHLGPDHPQMEIYEESKHGNIYFSLDNHTFLKADKLTPENTPAPTCAVCHMSGFNGVPATHDVGERLYWELQPKISTPQWYPSNFVPLGKAKPDEEKAKENRDRMMRVCEGCHSQKWVKGYFAEFDKVVLDYNKLAKSAKSLLDKIYAEGLANKTNGLDEYPEFMWYYIWHHDGRRWRMGAAMMGPDYTHWHGIVDAVMDKYGRMLAWYDTQKKIASIEKSVHGEKQTTPKKTETEKTSKRSPGFGALASAVAVGAVYAIYRRKSG